MQSKGKFTGWKDVFAFSFSQAIKEKGYIASTVFIAILLAGAMIVTNVLMVRDDMRQQKLEAGEDDSTRISTVYVKNETELSDLDFSEAGKDTILFEETKYENLPGTVEEKLKSLAKEIQQTETGESEVETAEDVRDGEEKQDAAFGSVVLSLARDSEGYVMNMYLPAGSDIDEDDCEELLDLLQGSLQQAILTKTGVDPQIVAMANAPVNYEVAKAGEEGDSMMEKVLKMLLPMLSAFLIYFMVLMNGQSVSKALVTEKTSKLMELLLTTVSPYALVFGKILANIAAALLQLVIWMAALIGGFAGGDAVAEQLAPGHVNMVLEMIKMFQDKESGYAFSVPAVIVGVIALIIGFSLYLILAGAVSAKISRSEDLSQGMAIFQVIVVICFFAAYFVAMMQNSTGEMIAMILRYIPFTAAFTLGTDLILGNIGLLGGLMSILISLAAIGILVVITGKIYKNALFYRGGKKRRQASQESEA